MSRPERTGPRAPVQERFSLKAAQGETWESRDDLQPHTRGSTGKQLAHGSRRPPRPPPAPGAVVKEAVRAASLGQESQQCWVVRIRRFFMGVDGAQQWKAESPIATRPCKAHPGLNQGAGSWYPRGAPHSPSSLKPPPDSAAQEIFPVLSPLSKALYLSPVLLLVPHLYFSTTFWIRTPILVGPHPYCPLTVNLWRNTNTRAGVS